MRYINTEIMDGVATLTLNDPDKRNAINLQMNDEICATLDQLEESAEVGSLIVTGAGKAFCAGADLGDLLAARERENIQDIYRGFLRIADSTLPTIAAVNGAAVGAGMNMALACDMILAGDSARFDSRFLEIGIHPGGGHTWRLLSRTNEQTMRSMVLFGQVLSSQQAFQRGLAWEVFPDQDLMKEAKIIGKKAASYSKELTRSTKEAFKELPTIDNSTNAVQHEVVPQVKSMESDAFRNLVTKLQKKISSGN
ncbi:MAG: enoyl-CoA hydratase [Acidimicrobiaceae bacterium]|nr:enoyl-CoA hydratase [Acidimicrobiaceae bacterium]|tara:strand:- start:64089 stop:64847 length:759 start_codon:yes stop_codon:yes gene_type:complete